jgi:hypothetical protein
MGVHVALAADRRLRRSASSQAKAASSLVAQLVVTSLPGR